MRLAIDMNEILDTLLGGGSDADIYLSGYEKNFYNVTSDCDNESLYIPNVLFYPKNPLLA